MKLFDSTGRDRWFLPRHLSEADILLLLEGELSARKFRNAQKHFDDCWSCRVRREKMEQAITAFMEYRESVETNPPPSRWAGFDRRLSDAAASPGSRGRLVAFAMPRLHWASGTACLALAAVMFLAWNRIEKPITVSAREFLEKSGNAETLLLGQKSDPVVYRRLKLRRKPTAAHPEASSTIDMWSDFQKPRVPRVSAVGGGPASPALWDEIEKVLRDNQIDARETLAVASHNHWRSSVRSRQEEVLSTQLGDGHPALALKTASDGAHRAGQIIEMETIARTDDWHTVEQKINVQGEGEIREYQLTEIQFEVLSAKTIPSWLTENLEAGLPVHAPPVSRTEHIALDPVPAAAAIESAEVEVLDAIHQTGLCLGQPVEIDRDSRGWIHVRGLVETDRQKQALLASLRDKPFTRVDVRTVEESVAGFSLAAPEDIGNRSESLRVEARPLPIQAELERYFARTAGARNAGERLVALSNRVISLSEASMAEAWALRRLAEAYPAERFNSLRGSSRRLLNNMVREHAGALRSLLAQSRAALDPVLIGIGAGLEAAPDGNSTSVMPVTALFGAVQEAHRLARYYFAGAEDETSAGTPASLLTTLYEAERQASQLEQGWTQLFFGDVAIEKLNLRREP